MKLPKMTPAMKGTEIPATATLMAARPTRRTSFRSVSMPVSSSSRITPNWAMAWIIAF